MEQLNRPSTRRGLLLCRCSPASTRWPLTRTRPVPATYRASPAWLYPPVTALSRFRTSARPFGLRCHVWCWASSSRAAGAPRSRRPARSGTRFPVRSPPMGATRCPTRHPRGTRLRSWPMRQPPRTRRSPPAGPSAARWWRPPPARRRCWTAPRPPTAAAACSWTPVTRLPAPRCVRPPAFVPRRLRRCCRLSVLHAAGLAAVAPPPPAAEGHAQQPRPPRSTLRPLPPAGQVQCRQQHGPCAARLLWHRLPAVERVQCIPLQLGRRAPGICGHRLRGGGPAAMHVPPPDGCSARPTPAAALPQPPQAEHHPLLGSSVQGAY